MPAFWRVFVPAFSGSFPQFGRGFVGVFWAFVGCFCLVFSVLCVIFRGVSVVFPGAFWLCFLLPLFRRLVLAAAVQVPPLVWLLVRLSFPASLPARRFSSLAVVARPPLFGRLSRLRPSFLRPPFPALVRRPSPPVPPPWCAPWLPPLLPCSSAFPAALARLPCSRRAPGAAAVRVRGRSVRYLLGLVFPCSFFCRQASSRPALGVPGSRLVVGGFSSRLRRRCFSGGFLFSGNGINAEARRRAFFVRCFSVSYPHFTFSISGF